MRHRLCEAPISHSGLPCVRMPALPRVAVLPAGTGSQPKSRSSLPISRTKPSSRCRRVERPAPHRPGLQPQRRSSDPAVETTLSEIMCGLVSSGLGVAICDPFTAGEFASRGVVARRFLPRIDFEFAAVFPPQRRPSPVALELVETLRLALVELDHELMSA